MTAGLPEPPANDADIPRWIAQLGLPGLVDIHVHFLPEPCSARCGPTSTTPRRTTAGRGPSTTATTNPPASRSCVSSASCATHRWSTRTNPEWPSGSPRGCWTSRTTSPKRYPPRTLYPEPEVTRYLGAALDAGARCIKVHVQVGGFDPADPLLDPACAMIAEAAVPVVVHCGHGPLRGAHTGLDVFEQELDGHPTLVTVLAHAGMPDYTDAVKLALRYPNVYLDTTMVGTAFTENFAPIPPDWPEHLVTLGDRMVFGTDFSQIPHEYAEQARVVHRWAVADDRLGVDFLRRVLHTTRARLLGVSDQLG